MTRLAIPPNSYFTGMFTWLVTQYGPSGDRWQLTDLSYVEFEYEKDAVLFALKWL